MEAGRSRWRPLPAALLAWMPSCAGTWLYQQELNVGSRAAGA